MYFKGDFKMKTLNSKTDILDEVRVLTLDMKISSTGDKVTVHFFGEMDQDTKEILTSDDHEKINTHLKEISNIINNAIVKEIKEEVSRLTKEDLSFVEFLQAIDESDDLKKAVDTVMDFFKKM